jgi:hypothetical protein
MPAAKGEAMRRSRHVQTGESGISYLRQFGHEPSAERRGQPEAAHVLAELRGIRDELARIAAALQHNALQGPSEGQRQPTLITVDEAGESIFRRSRRAMHMAIRRGAIPGVIRSGQRRILIDRDVALEALRAGIAPVRQ